MSSIGQRALLVTIVATIAVFAVLAGPAGAEAQAAASPVPGVPPGYRPLTIRTLPPIPGVRMQLNATELVTGPDGTVRTLITTAERDALIADRDAHLRMISKDVTLSPGQRGRFHGWYQAGYDFTPQNPVGQVEVAAFDLDNSTTFRFVDRHHQVLHPGGITDVQLRNSLGGLVDIGKPKPVWLRSAHVVSIAGNVLLKDVQWRLASVMFHGANIVQRGRQHFTPRDTPAVDVRSEFVHGRVPFSGRLLRVAPRVVDPVDAGRWLDPQTRASQWPGHFRAASIR